jgi:hypothetical protein
MKRHAIALAAAFGLSLGSGCSGFVSGLKHAATGEEFTVEEKAKPGYDWGVAVTNIVIALGGYAVRHFQDKLKVQIPPKGGAPVDQQQ